jgi:phosphonate transport system substrate-binding protein
MLTILHLGRQCPAAFGLVLFLLCWGAQPAQGGDAPALRIGLLPDDRAQALLARFERMRIRLAKTLQRPVKVTIPSLERPCSYKELVDAFVGGKIDIAYFGGATFLEASDRTPTAPLVMRKRDTKFRSYFITRAGSKAISLEGLKGMRFAFGDKDSTSGYFMPFYYLKELGIYPDKDFQGPPQFSGTHSKTLEWVLSGRVDAGAMNGEFFDRLLRKKKLDLKKIDIAWVSPAFPDYIWAAREDVPLEARTRVQRAFLDLSTTDKNDAAVLNGLGADYYVLSDLRAYERLRHVLDSLGRKKQ